MKIEKWGFFRLFGFANWTIRKMRDGSEILPRTFVGSDGFGLGWVEWKYSCKLEYAEVKKWFFYIFCRVGNMVYGRKMTKNGKVGKWAKSEFVSLAISFKDGTD